MAATLNNGKRFTRFIIIIYSTNPFLSSWPNIFQVRKVLQSMFQNIPAYILEHSDLEVYIQTPQGGVGVNIRAHQKVVHLASKLSLHTSKLRIHMVENIL